MKKEGNKREKTAGRKSGRKERESRLATVGCKTTVILRCFFPGFLLCFVGQAQKANEK